MLPHPHPEAEYAKLLDQFLMLSRFSSHLAMLSREDFLFPFPDSFILLRYLTQLKLFFKNPLHVASRILFLALICKLYFLYFASQNKKYHLHSSLIFTDNFLEVEVSNDTLGKVDRSTGYQMTYKVAFI